MERHQVSEHATLSAYTYMLPFLPPVIGKTRYQLTYLHLAWA